MILIIPALQLIDGHCSLFIKGEHGTENLYNRLSDRPAELCTLWRKENAKTIHITDYDSNYSTHFSNFDSIIYLAESVDIPFQVLANFRSKKECEYLLDNGIYRIAFGELALSYPDDVRDLIKKYSASKIIAYIETKNCKVNFSQHINAMDCHELITYFKELGFQRLILKEDTWLHSPKGFDEEKLKSLAEFSGMRITLFEGVTSPEQLWKLNELSKYGIDSVIMGQALYENNFPCQKIWRLIEADLENN
jgi:phosphoribosylformimino-5-aminoimidazole carboxamide ribotide isomerase